MTKQSIWNPSWIDAVGFASLAMTSESVMNAGYDLASGAARCEEGAGSGGMFRDGGPLMKFEAAAIPNTTADVAARGRRVRIAVGGLLRSNGANPIGNRELEPHGDPSGAEHPFFTR